MPTLPDLRGVLVALATPMTREGVLDEPALLRLVDHCLAGGVDGLLALGSTGEVAYLDARTRRRVLELVVERAAGRVPLLAGVAQTATAAAAREVAAVAASGACAALVAPPFYSPADQRTVLRFFTDVGRASSLPLLVYNIPGFTKVVVAPATVAALASDGVIVGLKDSSRDFEYFEQVLGATRDVPGFRTFVGTDTLLLASLAMGASGTICMSANLAPTWPREVVDAFEAGDRERAREAQDRIVQLVGALRTGVFPAGIKSALALAGICGPWMAPPSHALSSAETAALEAHLTRLEALPMRSAERSA